MIPRHLFLTRWLWRWVLTVGVGGGAVLGQVTQPSPIFGYVRTTLNGGGVQGGVTMVGPTFVERVAARATLQAGAPRPNELTAVGVTWGAKVWKTHPDARSHFVEVLTSTNPQAVGLASEIVSHTTNTLTIADDWSALLRGGETIQIRAHKTLAGVFGAANEAGLVGGDPTNADVISVLAEGQASKFTTYYYRTGSALGGAGWRSSANPFVDEASRPLRTGHGLIIKRRSPNPATLVLQGFVKTGIWKRTLPKGYALVDPLAPITDQRGSLPVPGYPFVLGGSAGISVLSSGLASTLTAGSPQTADLVSLAGTVASFYLATPSGLSNGGWRLTSNPLVDQQNTVIPPASALMIQNRGASKRWSRPQPFITGTP